MSDGYLSAGGMMESGDPCLQDGFSPTYGEQLEAFIAELRQRLKQAEARTADRESEAAACHDIMAECRNIAGAPHNSTVDAVRGLLARAEQAEAALAQCQAWRQEDADNLSHCVCTAMASAYAQSAWGRETELPLG